MAQRASGEFEVKLIPQPEDADAVGADLGRLTIVKQFSGELVGSSIGVMLAVRTAVQGSAGYVALERVTGELGGRSGSFVLQHSGTMDRGAPSLSVSVVPDSGSGQLSGISGQLEIIIADGTHSYNFDYELPE